MNIEYHFAEAISGFSPLSQTGVQAVGNFWGHVVKAGQVVSNELSTNLFAAIPTIAALNFGLTALLDLPASWLEKRYKDADPKLKVWQGIFVYGTIFTSVALFNIGFIRPFIHTLPKLVSIAIAVTATALRALKSWYVNTYLPSKANNLPPSGTPAINQPQPTGANAVGGQPQPTGANAGVDVPPQPTGANAGVDVPPQPTGAADTDEKKTT